MYQARSFLILGSRPWARRMTQCETRESAGEKSDPGSWAFRREKMPKFSLN